MRVEQLRLQVLPRSAQSPPSGAGAGLRSDQHTARVPACARHSDGDRRVSLCACRCALYSDTRTDRRAQAPFPSECRLPPPPVCSQTRPSLQRCVPLAGTQTAAHRLADVSCGISCDVRHGVSVGGSLARPTVDALRQGHQQCLSWSSSSVTAASDSWHGLADSWRAPASCRVPHTGLEAQGTLRKHGEDGEGRRSWKGRRRVVARAAERPPPVASPFPPYRPREQQPVRYKLVVKGLSRYEPPYGQILDSVTFQVQPGQLFGLIGPSGSGKSTVLRALNCLWLPERGAVLLDGEDVRDLPEQALRIRVGMVFQNPNLFEGTVEFNVKYGPKLRGIELSGEEVQQLLSRAGLQPSSQLLQRNVNELSGGEAQRVSIARALANSPEVLLMDEPTSSLDPSATRKVEETISRLQHAEGLTVVLVSHSMTQIERLAEVAGLLDNGRIVAVGPPMELRESENPKVASFFTGELD